MFLLTACAKAPSTKPAPCPPEAPAPATSSELAEPRVGGSLPAELASLRKAGLDAWAAGDIERAVKLFGSFAATERLTVDEALYTAVVNELAKRQQAVGLELSKLEPVVCEVPPSQAVVKKKGPASGRRPIALAFKSSNQGSGHYSERGAPIEMVRQTVSTPSAYRGMPLRAVLTDDEPTRYVFGSSTFGDTRLFVAVGATSSAPARVFDLTSLQPKLGVGVPIDVVDAHLADGVLYAQLGRLRVAEGGFITAWDSASGRLLWRSPSSTANGEAFFVGDGFLAAAFNDGSYHFVVTLLDRATGATIARGVPQSGYSQGFRFENNELVATANSGSFTFEVRR